MAGGLDVLNEEASASLRYQSLKEEQKRAAKAFVEEMDVRIFVRVRRVYLIVVQSLHTAGTNQTLPLPTKGLARPTSTGPDSFSLPMQKGSGLGMAGVQYIP